MTDQSPPMTPSIPLTTADPSQLLIILVDLQPHFVDTVSDAADPVLARIQQLLILSGVLEIPVLVTLEEPIPRKRTLIDCLATQLPDNAVTLPKLSYDLSGDPDIHRSIVESNRRQCVVVGTETDVCIMQSVLGLLKLGLEVFVVEDCLLTSSTDASAALWRMRNSGAIPTTWKSLYYELLQTDELDNQLRADEQLIHQGFVPPEQLEN